MRSDALVRAVVSAAASIAFGSAAASPENEGIRAATDAYVRSMDVGQYDAAVGLLMRDFARTPEQLQKDEARFARLYGQRTGRRLVKVHNDPDRRMWGASYEVTTTSGQRVEELIPVAREGGTWKVMARSVIPCSLGCFKEP